MMHANTYDHTIQIMSPSCLSQFSSVAFLWSLSVTVRGKWRDCYGTDREGFKSLYTGQGERAILLDLPPKLKSWRSSKHNPFITAAGVQYLTVMPLAYVYEHNGQAFFFIFFFLFLEVRKVEKSWESCPRMTARVVVNKLDYGMFRH